MTRRIVGLTIDGDRVPLPRDPWAVVEQSGRVVGRVTSAVWSPRLAANVAIGMLERAYCEVGTSVTVELDGHRRPATVSEMPFPGASQR